jgi:hypothetical protein
MVSIFIESSGGNAIEQPFLQILLKRLGKTDFNFVNVGGYKKLQISKNKLLDNQDQGIKNLIVFDADTPQNEGGFKERYNHLKQKLKELGITQYDIFLFPNNQDDGDLEVLLERIINKDHEGLLKCFEGYEKCISLLGKDYASPNQKAKMYAYMTAMPKSNKENENFKNKGDWSFQNPQYWQLDSPYLNALRDFFTNVF